MKRIAVSAAVALLLLTGCSAAQEHETKRGRGDAPVAGKTGDDSPAFCTNMPDEFGNVCGKCLAHFPPWAFITTTSTGYSPSSLGMFQAPEQCGGTVVTGAPPVISNSSAMEEPDNG